MCRGRDCRVSEESVALLALLIRLSFRDPILGRDEFRAGL